MKKAIEELQIALAKSQQELAAMREVAGAEIDAALATTKWESDIERAQVRNRMLTREEQKEYALQKLREHHDDLGLKISQPTVTGQRISAFLSDWTIYTESEIYTFWASDLGYSLS